MDAKTGVRQSALDVGSSPPLTSSLHSRNSASSATESAYLRQSALLRWTRLGLSGLVLAIALAIVGCTGHVVRSYNQTNLGPEWWLPLWPINVDLKPTVGTMVPAAITSAASLVYLAFAAIPSPRARTLHQTWLFVLSSVVSFVVTLFAVLFKQLLLYQFDPTTRDTLQSWTCKFYKGAQAFQRDASDLNISLSGDALIPIGFKRLCLESMASQWLTVVLLVLELLCCATAAWGVLSEKKISKHRQARYQGEKCESEFS